LTSQDRKKIMEMKKMNPFHDGRLSRALYMMNTQPSCDAATYTVKKLVAVIRTTSSNQIKSKLVLLMSDQKLTIESYRVQLNYVSSSIGCQFANGSSTS